MTIQVYGQAVDSLKDVSDHMSVSVPKAALETVDSVISPMQRDSLYLLARDGGELVLDTIHRCELSVGHHMCDTVENTIEFLTNEWRPIDVGGVSKVHFGFIEEIQQKVDGTMNRMASQVGRLPAVDLNSISYGTFERIFGPLKVRPGPTSGISLENGLDLPGMNGGSLPGVMDIDHKLGSVDEVHSLVNRYQSDLASIKSGQLSRVESLPEAIESRVEGLEEVNSIRDASMEFETIKAKWNDPEVMKEQALNKAKETAVNHFAGKEKQLKTAMEKLASLKSKMPDAEEVIDLFAKRQRFMQGRSFAERLVPGLALQFQKEQSYWLDVNPHIGLTLARRWLAGLGWNERMAYNFETHTWDKGSRIYGFRSYVQFRAKDRLWLKGDAERMRTLVGSAPLHSNEASGRHWVWSYFVGVKKDVRVSSLIDLSVQTLYNIYNPDRRSPYARRLNVRVGVEFSMKDKKPRRVGTSR